MIYVTVFFEVNERDWLIEIIDRHQEYTTVGALFDKSG